MAEIIFRLPSKAVQYGYVEVRATPEGFGMDASVLAQSPDIIGKVYATYVADFLKGEQEGMESLLAAKQPEAAPGDPEAAAKRLDEGRKPRTVAEDEAMAAELIKRELGGTVVEEIMSDEDVDTRADVGAIGWLAEAAAELIKNELGGTAVAEYKVGDTVTVGGIEFTKHSEAPWDEVVDGKPKPWEQKGGPTPKVAEIDW